MKIAVVFYSTYGHMYQMARAGAEGAGQVEGAEVRTLRVAETLPREVLEMMGAVEAQKAFAEVPVAKADDLDGIDGLILGVSTRYGMMAAQMKAFLDSTGPLWVAGKLIDKPVSVISSTATQHGGNELAILTAYASLMHHGMIPVGLPYSFQGQRTMDEITGGSPYGASTIAGGEGRRLPSENELEAARFQGRRLAQVASRLAGLNTSVSRAT